MPRTLRSDCCRWILARVKTHSIRRVVTQLLKGQALVLWWGRRVSILSMQVQSRSHLFNTTTPPAWAWRVKLIRPIMRLAFFCPTEIAHHLVKQWKSQGINRGPLSCRDGGQCWIITTRVEVRTPYCTTGGNSFLNEKWNQLCGVIVMVHLNGRHAVLWTIACQQKYQPT